MPSCCAVPRRIGPRRVVAARLAGPSKPRLGHDNPCQGMRTAGYEFAGRLLKCSAIVPAGRGRTVSDSGWGEACKRSEEHLSELPSLMRISYAVFCLKKKINLT